MLSGCSVEHFPASTPSCTSELTHCRGRRLHPRVTMGRARLMSKAQSLVEMSVHAGSVPLPGHHAGSIPRNPELRATKQILPIPLPAGSPGHLPAVSSHQTLHSRQDPSVGRTLPRGGDASQAWSSEGPHHISVLTAKGFLGGSRLLRSS